MATLCSRSFRGWVRLPSARILELGWWIPKTAVEDGGYGYTDFAGLEQSYPLVVLVHWLQRYLLALVWASTEKLLVNSLAVSLLVLKQINSMVQTCL